MPDEDDSSQKDVDSSSSGRKERVIHTRVPAVLEKELKRLAISLRVPVSNVVRAILEDAVAAVDVVGRKAEGEMRGMAERLAHNRDRLKGMAHKRDEDAASKAEMSGGAVEPTSLQHLGVLGLQPMLLVADSTCASCGRAIEAGGEAYLGISQDPGAARVVIGRECLPANKGKTEEEP
jgi:hypothetical protein